MGFACGFDAAATVVMPDLAYAGALTGTMNPGWLAASCAMFDTRAGHRWASRAAVVVGMVMLRFCFS
jgi:hypothetical protein